MEDQLTTAYLQKKVVKLMGNRFEFTAECDDDSILTKGIAEVQRIEKLLTTFSPDSQVNHVNDQAGIRPVKVDKEVYDLVERSLRISNLTQGAFDITYGGVDKRLWNFDQTMTSLPDRETAKASVRLINYKNVELDSSTHSVFLREKGMRIGFGGIGKGYAADRAKQVLINAGARSGIVNASGDLTCWGTHPNGSPWTIGIVHPDFATQAFASLSLSNVSIATSGSYEKFVIIDGKKYSHTIDPRTGLPVSGMKSVSIICPSAELADALATPVMIMGTRIGLNMINQMRSVGCIIVDDENCVYTSSNIHAHEKNLSWK